MEPSRDREEKREGGGSQRANKQIREGRRGALSDGDGGDEQEMEDGDRLRQREAGGGGSSFTQHPRFRHVATSVLVT